MGNKDWFPFKRIPARGRSSYHASNGNVYAKRDLLARERRYPGIFLKLA
jgi:hypothetical protein